MSVVLTKDLFCDVPGCGLWSPNLTTTADEPNPSLRGRAQALGWTAPLVEGPHGKRVRRDVCPNHTASPEALFPTGWWT